LNSYFVDIFKLRNIILRLFHYLAFKAIPPSQIPQIILFLYLFFISKPRNFLFFYTEFTCGVFLCWLIVEKGEWLSIVAYYTRLLEVFQSYSILETRDFWSLLQSSFTYALFNKMYVTYMYIVIVTLCLCIYVYAYINLVYDKFIPMSIHVPMGWLSSWTAFLFPASLIKSEMLLLGLAKWLKW
jgi:hypothetical protein